MRKETLAAGGAIGASLVIASCCLAPALFLLFGVSVGALGMLSALEPVRPFFMALGGAALVYAAWRVRRPPSGDPDPLCSDTSCAPGSRTLRRTRRFVAIAFVLYGLAVAYPYLLEAVL